ncbi:helix-turn-helix transcriptional regulator [Streptomyces sp. NPDC020965]|uniref:helix-turn-helix transcriptional regulator n=1 Tax=Streptomyces sp. NPDC020965 TaxID=3365105 RepID=UPI0037B363AD
MSELTREPANGLEWLGHEIEEALRHKGAKQRDLAEATGYKEPYVSKVKSGKAMPSPQFVEGCDRFFDTSGYFARILMRVSRRGHPSWFVPYLNLERAAQNVSDYSNAFVMGMLQTPAYAEAVFRSTHPRESDERISARVEARVGRRVVMERKSPPLLWVILHESVVRTLVGGRSTMVEQLEHLAAVGSTPHISLQVMPFNGGAPSSSLPFTLLTQKGGAPVLYSETRELGHVNDSAAAVESAQAAYDRLRAAALSPERSQALFQQIAEEYAR